MKKVRIGAGIVLGALVVLAFSCASGAGGTMPTPDLAVAADSAPASSDAAASDAAAVSEAAAGAAAPSEAPSTEPTAKTAEGAYAAPPSPAAESAAIPPVALAAETDKPGEAAKPADKPADKPLAAEPKPGERLARYLSADDSNSQASPVIVRMMAARGRYAMPETVRTYEFLNYADFSYAPAPKGRPAIYADLRDLGGGRYSLLAAVRAEDRDFSAMPPLRLTVLLDESGSMAGKAMDMAKGFLRGLGARLRPGDSLALVAFNRSARVLLAPTGAGAGLPPALDKALGLAAPNDVTDLAQGLSKAYELASAGYAGGAMNRVVLLSDGGANAGKLAKEIIAKGAADSERQGIYLVGVGLGGGFNDSLMDSVTDAGRGAYLFIDSEAEVAKQLVPRAFVSNFDLALKDVRLKLTLPAGFAIEEFHGEAMSAVASEVTPQYLAPNDQMLYHMVLKAPEGAKTAAGGWKPDPAGMFDFACEYVPLGGPSSGDRAVEKKSFALGDILGDAKNIRKADALVAVAEALKKQAFPMEDNVAANLELLGAAFKEAAGLAAGMGDADLDALAPLGERYLAIVKGGPAIAGALDKDDASPGAVLGIPKELLLDVKVSGANPQLAVKGIAKLGYSTRVVPMEGYRFLALSSGPVWNPSPEGGTALSAAGCPYPDVEFMGSRPFTKPTVPCYDFHSVALTLRAPAWAKSFSFDFDFFSAEYPGYVKQSYNDSFFAVLRAASTNGGRPTNIAFDSNGGAMEVDNAYFQNEFHPLPNAGTGFDRNGSSGWLRTSWPIKGGEEFTIEFNVHDEGDGVFDSLVLLDSFAFHDYAAVGTTDPLN